MWKWMKEMVKSYVKHAISIADIEFVMFEYVDDRDYIK